MALTGLQQGTIVGAAVAPPDAVWRLSLEQFHQMVRAGILSDDDPVEFLDGLLVPKMIKNPAPRVSTQLVREALEAVVGEAWHVPSQEPITLAGSEPEPDVAVVRGSPRDYAAGHPRASDVALVVEVADASLQRDRTIKKRLYAEAGIGAYWIVNLAERQVEVYTDPSNGPPAPDYRDHRIHRSDDAVALLLANKPVARIPVAAMLP
jgi:Uma2 family endonuclease